MFKIKHKLSNDEPAVDGEGGAPSSPSPEAPPAPAPEAVGSSPSEDATASPESGEAPAASASTEASTTTEANADDWRAANLKAMGLEEGTPEYTKRMNMLQRHTSLESALKSGFEAQDKIRAGEISNGLPENPSEEQLAEYRAAHGIPETAEGYELSLGEGLVLGEADQQVLGNVFEIAHQKNIPADVMNDMANAMLGSRKQVEEARVAQDAVDKQTSEKILREAWGQDYETNRNMIMGSLNMLPEDVKQSFLSARLQNGKGLLNEPAVSMWLADNARKANPTATVVPNTSNPVQTMNEEIAKIEREEIGQPGWHKNKSRQEYYLKLLDAREKHQALSQ